MPAVLAAATAVPGRINANDVAKRPQVAVKSRGDQFAASAARRREVAAYLGRSVAVTNDRASAMLDTASGNGAEGDRGSANA